MTTTESPMLRVLREDGTAVTAPIHFCVSLFFASLGET